VQVKTPGKFSSLAWSPMANYSADFGMGLLAGGMTDGSICLWDPSKVIEGHAKPQLSAMKHHTGAVSLHFNPTAASNHLLASGGADANVLIHALDRPDTPKQPFVPAPDPSAAKHTAEVTKVAWNTQVPHILASASMNGSTHIWDLRQKKSWCELRDAKKCPVTDLCWNPTEGLQIVTASGDDANPVVSMWDLRSSTTMPLSQLAGHTQGILSMSWCPHDTSLLLTCGKDNHTFVWDLFERRPVFELSADTTASAAANSGFGGFGMSAAGRRYECNWSPKQRAVLSTCSFDRKVQVYSLSGTRTASARAPKWLRKPGGAGFGFGGKLATFAQPLSAEGKPLVAPPGQIIPAPVTVRTVVEDKAFVNASVEFEAALATKNLKGLCEVKAAEADAKAANKEGEEGKEEVHEASVWRFVQLVFEDSARAKLLLKLGFDPAAIAAEVASMCPDTATLPEPQPSALASDTPPVVDGGANSNATAEDFFGGGGDGASSEAVITDAQVVEKNGSDHLVKEEKEEGEGDKKEAPVSDTAAVPTAAPAPSSSASLPGAAGAGEEVASMLVGESPAVKRALLVGNFAAAVDGCFARGQLADALLLASCGGAELWEATRLRYFEAQAAKRPFLAVVAAIINSRLGDLVATSDPAEWKETLAILSTYGKSDEFSSLCEQLGEVLEGAGDEKAASLCYLCAINVPKTVSIWIGELKQQQAKSLGRLDSMLLHALVEKVTVFTASPDGSDATSAMDLGPEMAALFTQYGEMLAQQGEMVTAVKYLSLAGEAASATVELQHRLFLAAQLDRTVGPQATPPPLFAPVTIGVCPHSGTVQVPLPPAPEPSPAEVAAAAADIYGAVPQQTYGQVPGGQAAAANQRTMAEGTDPNTGLPLGWIWQQDQAGNVYYVNTISGVTQWEVPQPAPVAPAAAAAPSPAVAAPAQAVAQPATYAPQPEPAPAPVAAPAAPLPGMPKLDGFKSGPGKKSEAYVPQVAPGAGADFGASADPSAVPEELKAIVPLLNDLQAKLTSSCTAAVEKKQLGEVSKAAAILIGKLGHGAVSSEVGYKALAMVNAVGARDYATAGSIHKDLTTSAWDEHKDWVKGIKGLVMLAQKKL